MRYIRLTIRTDREHLEGLQAALIDAGFSGMQIDDPADIQDILDHRDLYKYDYINEDLLADPARKPVVTLYFEDDEEGRADLARAVSLLDEGAEYECVAAGDDSEWLYKWQEHFRPTRVGKRMVVKPGWEEYEAEPGDLVIEMEPGMAFGSGLHETTSMCIKALEKLMGDDADPDEAGASAGGQRAGHRVLDVGTGTGILAIAAVLLGADEALGVDIDEDAVRVALDNVEKNGMSDRISIREGDLTEGVDYAADIVVANLMADLVTRLSPAAWDHLAPGGYYISSGILDIREEAVAAAVRAAGFDIREILRDGEWRAIVAQKSR